MPYFYSQEELRGREIAPGVTIRPVVGERLHMVIIDAPPGGEIPTHSHPQEQCGRVLQGELRFTIGDETCTLKEGDCYMIPGGVEHGGKIGPSPLQVVDVFSPPRDDYTLEP